MKSSMNLADSLYWVLTSTTSLPDLYVKRCGGFRNEKEVEENLRKKGYALIDGGQLIFIKKNNASEHNKIFYYTVSNDDMAKYAKLYENLSKMSEIERLFFIHVNDDGWSATNIAVKNNGENMTREIMKPNMHVFEFSDGMWIGSSFDEIKSGMSKKRPAVCNSKDPSVLGYMKGWDPKDLAKIYCNRYVLDVELAEYKKNMMDFDAMILHDGNYIAVESKEKDPIGKWIKKTKDGKKIEILEPDESKWQFGWDTRRFAWYQYLKFNTDLDIWYLVREIDHQKKRKFLKWKKIDIDTFSKCAVWHFERKAGRGSTVEAQYSAFADF